MKKIPKKIWQLGKDSFEDLSSETITYVDSWKNLNPDWEYTYLSDKEGLNWILQNYGKEWHDLMSNVSVGVMKADTLRMMIMFKEGGVYADLDTKCCVPISEWYKKGEEGDVYITAENDVHFQQFLLIANKNHKLFEEVLSLIKERLKDVDYSNKHFVHYVTGPGVWTNAIVNFLGIKNKPNNLLPEDEKIKESAKKKNIFYQGGTEGRIKFQYGVVVHLFQSNEKDKNQMLYNSWVTERDIIHKEITGKTIGNYQDYLENKHKYLNALPSNEGGKITKLVIRSSRHFIKDLPVQLLGHIKTSLDLNPDYDHYYFDDKDCLSFMTEHSSEELLQAYNNIKPGAYKADIFRYAFLYLNGGCWADISQVPVTPYDEMITDNINAIFCKDSPAAIGFACYNAIICVAPKNEVIQEVIKECIKNVKNKYYGNGTLDITGPQTLGRAYLKVFKNNILSQIPGQHGNTKLLYYKSHNHFIVDPEINKEVINPRSGTNHYELCYKNSNDRYVAIYEDKNVYYEKER